MDNLIGLMIATAILAGFAAIKFPKFRVWLVALMTGIGVWAAERLEQIAQYVQQWLGG